MTNVIEHTPSREPILRVQGLEMNLRTGQVRNQGRDVPVTPNELRVLYTLMRNSNRVSPMALLSSAVGYSEKIESLKVRSYIASLRRKLDDDHHVLIRSAHGLGYRLAGRTPPSPRFRP